MAADRPRRAPAAARRDVVRAGVSLGESATVSQLQEIIAIAVIVAITGVGLVVGLLRPGGRSTKELPPTGAAARPRLRARRGGRRRGAAGHPDPADRGRRRPGHPPASRGGGGAGDAARAQHRAPGARRRPAAAPAVTPGPVQQRLRAEPAGRCSPAEAWTSRRGRTSRTRCWPPTSASRRRWSWSTRCAPRSRSRAPATRRPCAGWLRADLLELVDPEHGPLDRLVPRRVAPGRHPRRRRQRHRQDHHGRQAGPRPRRRGQGRRARRGRHVPRRRRGPAADLGRAGRRDRPSAPTARAPTRRPWPSTPSRAVPSSRPTS